MASPFPGMDPYLENTGLWQGYHNALMTYACEAIQPVLPPNYVATIELRIYLERDGAADDTVSRPDLSLVKTGGRAGNGVEQGSGAEDESPGGGFWIEVPQVEVREAYLAIRRAPGGEIVTSIELLSPSNKRPGRGGDLYRRKQAAVMEDGLNLVEIDLLRAGSHTAAVPQDSLEPLPRYDYLACVYRSAKPWHFQVFPWTVRERLPDIPVPLADGDADVPLALQQVHGRTFASGAFRKLLDYDREPPVPFRQEDRDWADSLLRSVGLRGERGA